MLQPFLFLHFIGIKRLKNIRKAFHQDGVQPRVHGNTRRLPKHTLTLESVEYVVRFLLNYFEQHGLLLPGRVPGYARDDIKLLPSSTSKRGIWKLYCGAADQVPEIHKVAYSTFCHVWKHQLPHLILMKPMTDLCWTCQKNSTAVLRSANCPDKDKSSALVEFEEHLRIVQTERSFYKTSCKTCKDCVTAQFTVGDEFQPPPLHHNHLPTRGTSQSTTRLITHSRCIFPRIPCSLVPSTSSLRGSVQCLG